eukprot:TRINITY_DN61028_c0_g1_i1.p2 TRINITY_DN61028_c0_g1~~TRINITY_DN61028_c0_g1_i1.p2  ORF type:complete len:231 (+),score=77.54 TRINITY_DN61028_c0_g1_i1:73-693(+)
MAAAAPPRAAGRGARAALLLCALPAAAGWSTGDFVPIFRRSLYDGKVTSSHELGPELSPRFGHSKSVRLHGLSHAEIGSQDYKISFELGHGLGRKTTWITVQSGCYEGSQYECHALSSLTFEFVYEKGVYGKITDFQWHATYAKHPVDHILVHYDWRQEHDKDLHLALLLVHCVSVLGGVVLLSMMLISTQSVRRGEMLVRDVRSQ